MKKLKILVSFILFISSALLAIETECECGSHSTGITIYEVSGTDCCKHTIVGVGWEQTYVKQNNGVWALDSVTQITGEDAQDDCCEET